VRKVVSLWTITEKGAGFLSVLRLPTVTMKQLNSGIFRALFPRPNICATNVTVVSRFRTTSEQSEQIAETSFNQDLGYVNPGQDTDDHIDEEL
jgi:hypothetical protein